MFCAKTANNCICRRNLYILWVQAIRQVEISFKLCALSTRRQQSDKDDTRINSQCTSDSEQRRREYLGGGERLQNKV